MSIDIYDNVQFDSHVGLSSEHINKSYEILLLSHNSIDILLISKLLKQLGSFKIHEAVDVPSATKLSHHVSFDLIIVDDMLSTVNGGYEVLSRLNKSLLFKDVPKVMLLTDDYKESLYATLNLDNMDFIKKPIDGMIFKTRIHSILKNRQDTFMGSSIFENMIDRKISEAKEFLKIYKSFLDIEDNILFVYDKRSNQVVESNKVFTKFFGDAKVVNRVLSNFNLLKRFAPVCDNPIYLNHHHPVTWIDTVTSVSNFNFLITLRNRSKDYTFTVFINKIKIFKKEMYIIKLSNQNINNETIKLSQIQNQKINNSLVSLKKTVQTLEHKHQKDQIVQDIKLLLRDLDIPNNHFLDEGIEEDVVNVHFIIANILKSGGESYYARLNDCVVGKDFAPDNEILHAKVSADDIHDLVRGVLTHYNDADVLHVDIKAYQLDQSVKIEIITSTDGSKQYDDITPKQLKNALINLKATMKTYFLEDKNIFMITIPA